MAKANFTADFLDQRGHEVQRQSHFSIQIEKFSEEFSFHLRSGNLPTIGFDVISTRVFNEVNKQAGARSFDDLNITIHDAIGFNIEGMLHDWQEEIQKTDNGYMGYAEQYKRTVYITEFNVNGEPRSKWKLTGAFPSSVNYGNLDKENVDKKSIDVTISYNKATLMFLTGNQEDKDKKN